MPTGVYERKPRKKKGAEGPEAPPPAKGRRGRKPRSSEAEASGIKVIIGRALVSFGSDGDATIIRIEPAK